MFASVPLNITNRKKICNENQNEKKEGNIFAQTDDSHGILSMGCFM